MRRRTTKELLQDLANLDTNKSVYIVCEDWVHVDKKEKCTLCNGEGSLSDGTNSYVCPKCCGNKTLWERKKEYVVKYVGHYYPEIKIESGIIEHEFYYDIQGFCNNEIKAQVLANKLNKGE